METKLAPEIKWVLKNNQNQTLTVLPRRGMQGQQLDLPLVPDGSSGMDGVPGWSKQRPEGEVQYVPFQSWHKNCENLCSGCLKILFYSGNCNRKKKNVHSWGICQNRREISGFLEAGNQRLHQPISWEWWGRMEMAVPESRGLGRDGSYLNVWKPGCPVQPASLETQKKMGNSLSSLLSGT